jgi:molybdopterin converting factor small subunit
MKITIEIVGLPDLAQATGTKEILLDLPGVTVPVARVLDHLVEQSGPPARKALFDRDGVLHPIVQIALNDQSFISPDRLDTPLRDGDTLTFMLLMAGG